MGNLNCEMTNQELKAHIEKTEKMKRIEDAFDELVWKHLNSMSTSDRKELCDVLANKFVKTHNTLQQSLIGLIYGVFRKLVEMKMYSDLRNEQSYKFINDCVKMDYYFPFI